MSKPFDKLWNMIRLSDEDDYDDYDDYDEFDDYDDDDDFDDIPAPVVKKKTTPKKEKASKAEPKSTAKKEKAASKKKTTSYSSTSSASSSKSTSKIVPLMSSSKSEVCVLRPTAFEDSRDITDVLLNGKAVVINLEGIDYDVAQRIIDFISGSCYAMAGNIEKISNYIFIVTPETIDISGDISEVISSGINLDLDF